ncbi:putative quinol monooxygenase [Suttonella ornithocola]|uniref:ABM domain-containing protein n=1 Tax=Suttonella ornithocola TaxID=279832 RepID=A0A380MST4_9GAMM|nr:antibiotic biosynthesis monooxygenase [Suttonella ornithocola]SUO94973.1 Uncharacterised protein [Suttonella ornithocola]
MNSSYVTLKGYLFVPDEDLAAVCEALPLHIALSNAEIGSLHFEVTQNSQNPNRFKVYECFVNQSAFLAYQARLAASQWTKVSQNATRHYHIPPNNDKENLS